MGRENMKFICEEQELLLCGEIDFDISELESNERDMYGKNGYDIIDNDFEKLEQDDELVKYQWMCETFGESVFELDVENRIIKLSKNFKAKNEYMLCLCAMNHSALSKKISRKITSEFERVTAEAVKKYLGENTKTLLIDEKKGENIDIKKIFEEKLEEKYNTDIESNFKNKNPRSDIIAWKKIDNRPGKIILIVQCKSGKNWKNAHTVNLSVWQQNIGDFASNPIIIFSITDLLNDEEIHTRGKEKGLVFDRARIIRLLATAESDELQNIRQSIQNMKLEDKLR